jgi:hypothetical protein
MDNRRMDILYTWVNGEDPAYQALYRRYAQRARDWNPERYRDIYTMLKYSMRSLDQFAPWVRDIYLLTCRPQIPDWLCLDHPRVHVVHHDDLFDPAYLPTFNCNAIESYLHRVPNPSDYLLYLNDDFLFGRPTGLHDFFTEDQRIKVYGTLCGERLSFRIYDGHHDIIPLGFIEHTPLLIYKPFWHNMLTAHAEALHRTRQNKFRQDTDLRMERLYRHYLLSQKRRHTVVVPFYNLLKYHTFHKITNHLARQVKGLHRLRSKQPKFYCLNDDQSDHPHEAVVKHVQQFLENYYPTKSRYEK